MAKREVDIKVKYIPDTSALKSALSGAQKIDFKIGGSGLKKELLTPVQNAMREVNKAIASGADNKTLLKLFQDVGKAADSAKLKATGMLTEINSGFNSAGNQKLLTDLEKYQKELDKVEKKISNWENKYGNKAMSQMKMDLGVGGISDAKKQTAELEEQVKLGKTLTQQELDRLDALKKYINTWNERKELADKGITRGGMESEASVLRSKISDIMTTVELPKTNVEWTKQLTPIINALGQAAGLSAQEINRLTIAIGQEDKAAKDAANENKKEALKLADVVTGTFLGTSVSSMFESALRRGVEFFKEYDETLTRTMMVTGMTRDEVNSLTSSYNELANQLSSTTKDVAAAQLVFYQQGLGTSEALKMTEASIAISKTGGIEAEEAANRLTAAIRGYKLAANDAMDIADKMSALDAAAASSVDELTIAMQKSASQARMAGLDLDYYMAYLSTMQEVTREAPENIGTAMKSITSRLQEITDIGKVEEDGTTFSNVAKALNSVGIAAVDSTGQLRSLQDVMNDLGPMWATLDKNHKAYLATVLAGNRQQSRFIALMDNYDRAMELVSVSQNASGESAKQLRAYNQGLEASFTRLNNAWQQFATKVADSDMIKGIIDLLADFVEILNKIPKPITQTIIPLTALTKGLQLLSNAGTLFSQAKGFIGQKLGISELNKDIKNMDNVLGQGMSTINKFGQTLKDAFDGFGNHKKQIDEVTRALEGNTTTLQSNTTAQEGSTLAKQSDDGVDAQEVVEANTNSAAQAAMKKAYDLATKSVKTQLDIMSTNSDAYIEEQERAIREAEAQIKKNKARENDLLAANKKERSRRKSELQDLRNAYERKVKNPASREMGGELYTDAIESLQKKGLLGEQSQLSLFGDSKDEQLIAEEMDSLAHEYGLGYHELQEVLKKESNEIFRINNEAIDEIRKKNKDLANEVSQIMKNITGFKNAVGKNTDILTSEQLLSGRETSLQKLDAFKSAKAVSGKQLKDLASDKFLGNFEKLNAVFGKINIGGGLVAGSLAKMGASFLGLDDDMSSALSTSVGLATSFAKFAPPWGAIIGASIGVIQFAFDKAYPSIEKTQEKLTNLQQEMDDLVQKRTNIATNLQVYEELSGKLDKTDEETQKLKDSTEELVKLVPGAVTGYNQYGEAVINTAKAYEELDKKQREMSANADKQLVQFDNLQKGAQKTGRGWAKFAEIAGGVAATVGGLAVTFGTFGLGTGAGMALMAGGTAAIGGGLIADASMDEKQIEENQKVWDENYSEILKAYQTKRDEFLIDINEQNKDTASKIIDSLISVLMEDGRNGRISDASKAINKMLTDMSVVSWSEINNAMSRLDIKSKYNEGMSFKEARKDIEKMVKQSLKDAGLSNEEIAFTITAMLNISWEGAAEVEALKKEIDTQIGKLRNGSGDQGRIPYLESFKEGLDELNQEELQVLKNAGMLDIAFTEVFEKNGGVKYNVSTFRDANGELNSSRMILNTINDLYDEQEEKQKKIAKYRALNTKEEEKYHSAMRKAAEDAFDGANIAGKDLMSDKDKEDWIQKKQKEFEGYDWDGKDSYMQNQTSATKQAYKAYEEYNDAVSENDKIIKEANRDTGEYSDKIDELIGKVESYKEPTFGEMAEALKEIESSFESIKSLMDSINESNGKLSFGDMGDLFSILDGYEQALDVTNMANASTQSYYNALGKINNALNVQNGYMTAQEGLEEGLYQLAIASAQARMEEFYIQLEQTEAELNYQNAILSTEKAAVDAALGKLKTKKDTKAAEKTLEETGAKLDTQLAAVSVSNEETKLNAKLELASDYAQKYAKLMREAEKGNYDGSIEKVSADIGNLKKKMTETINNSVKDLLDPKDIDGSIAALEKRSESLQKQIDNNNDAIKNSIGLKKKIADYLKDPTNIGNTAQVQGIKDASNAQKDYNEKLERTLTLLEKIEGLQHKIDENETFKDLYKGYSGEDYGRLLMSNLDLAQQQYEVYKDLFAMQQETTNQAAGDLLDSPYGQMFKIMDNGDIGWADASMYDKYKNLPDDMQEDIDNLVEAFQKQRDALRDTEQDLSKYAQEVKKVREELVAMEIEIENELVEAIKNREKILHDARMKALDDEVAMIEEAVEKRQKARDNENDNKELYEAQEALRRATLDSSGKNNASLLQLQQELEDKQLEISEKRFEQDMEDRKNWLQDTKDAETETYEYRLETMTWYWEQVQIIQEQGTEAMMQALITWNEQYRTTSELQQREMKRNWQETMDAMKAATDMGAELDKLTADIVDVTKEVENMNISINKLSGTWQKVTNDANNYKAAVKNAANYVGSHTSGTSNSTKNTRLKTKGSATLYNEIAGPPKSGDDIVLTSANMCPITGSEVDTSKTYRFNKTTFYKLKDGSGFVKARDTIAYKTGGMVDYTGPAWVDGTKSHPEAFLSAYQTEQIGALAGALDSNTVNNVSGDSNISFGSINFNVASMSSAADGRKALDIFVQGANDLMAKKGISTKLNLNVK